ncbi:hypothetical protein GUJ93_ZPchr0003g17525 [Zizania palustris]|uniref:Large ribosomal subunit protein uL6c n=1 Tax=Zizania palustris TaxID=103762 RepID=A0A8J5SL15_ZIZPA|nr:hypothetical protein GUJ93_ZPchr0003g17525 [Zizania palustris]
MHAPARGRHAGAATRPLALPPGPRARHLGAGVAAATRAARHASRRSPSDDDGYRRATCGGYEEDYIEDNLVARKVNKFSSLILDFPISSILVGNLYHNGTVIWLPKGQRPSWIRQRLRKLPCDGEPSMASLSLSPHHPCNSRTGFLGKTQGVHPCVIPAGRVGFIRRTVECKESRIGKKPVEVPSNVTLTLEEQFIKAKGPLGELSLNYPGEVKVAKEESGKLRVSKTVETKRANQMHGLFRTLTDNIIVGVSKGFDKKLQLVGVGYRAAVEGKDLVMNLGFSHPVRMAVPEGLQVKVEENTRIIVSGYDKSAIGQFAASIKKWRPPEPYKGKGIRYADEVVRRKEGKAGKKK